MPFFSPKTWKQRIVEFPGRRRLDDTSSADVYDVSRAEGTVTQEGDGFTAANMNDLEQRINNAVNDVAGLSADEYDPNATYSSGDLRIHDNILYKANQAISVAEPWTPAHWDATTIAAELKAQAEDISDLNSSYGTNENGSYLRMPDGTQICWLNTTVTDQAINTLYTNGVYQGIRNWTFPIPFIDSPSVSCGCFRYGTGASWGAINASTPTEAGLRAYDFVSREAGQNCLIQAIAIGRWKP